MKKNSMVILFAISFAYLFSVIIDGFLVLEKNPELKKIKSVTLSKNLSSSLFVKNKIVKKRRVVENDGALNDWVLNATVLGKPSFALMLNGKESEVLKIGDTLENFKVAKVEKVRVLFKSKNKDTWVYMKEHIPKSSGVIKVSKKQNKFRMSGKSFKKVMQNPDKLLKDINITPYFENNVIRGFKVNNIRKKSFLYVYGLRKDDIISEINGKKILSISAGINLYQKVMTLNKFTIKITRENEKKVLNYEIY